jgi:RNA polymerase sigma-70 factor (ECF subfamily)
MHSTLAQESARGDGESNDPADILIREEQKTHFLEQVERLPVPQRSVLLLHFLEDFSLEEIAEATGAQLGTVKSRLHYAKKALRQLLTEHENAP